MRPQVHEDGLGRAKGKQASSSLPTLDAHGWVQGPRTNNNLEGWHSKVKKNCRRDQKETGTMSKK